MAGRRSPNYPAVSFPQAYAMAQKIYENAQRHKTEKESLARLLGYSGLNGKSLRLLGTLNSHGLLAGSRDAMGITEMAEVALVDPETSESRYEAILECATKPAIYQEILDHFDRQLPSDEIIRPYVLKKGFSQSAADTLIRNLRDTMGFVDDEHQKLPRGGGSEGPMESQSSPAQPIQGEQRPATPVAPIVSEGARELFSYDFEPSGSLRLIVSAEVDTEEALDILQDLVELKRREVARRAKKQAQAEQEPDED